MENVEIKKVKEIQKLLNDNFLLLGGFEEYPKSISDLVDVIPFQYNNTIYYCPKNEQDCDIGINFFKDGIEWKKHDESEYDKIIAELKRQKIDAKPFVNDYFNIIESAIKNKPGYKAPDLGSDGIDKKILESFIETKKNQNGFLSDDQVALSLSYFLRNRDDVLVINPRSGRTYDEGGNSQLVLQDVIDIIDNADLTTKKYITFPYRHGLHFTSVVINIQKGKIIFSNSFRYDLKGNAIVGGVGGDLISDNIELKNLQESLKNKFGNNFNVVNAKCPAQGDSYMCGVHTVINSVRFCNQSLEEISQALSGTQDPNQNQDALDDVIESSQNQKNQLQLKLISAAKIWEEYGELYKGKSISNKRFDVLNSKKIDEYIGFFENILEGNDLTTNESLAKIEIQETIIPEILDDIKELYKNYKGGLIKNQFIISPNMELFSPEERSNQNFDTKIRNFILDTDDPKGLLDLFDKAIGDLSQNPSYKLKTIEEKLVEIAKYIDSNLHKVANSDLDYSEVIQDDSKKSIDKKTADKKSTDKPEDKSKLIDSLKLQKNNPTPNGPYLGCGFRFDVFQNSLSEQISIKINEIFSPALKRFFIPPDNKTFLDDDRIKSLSMLDITEINIGGVTTNLTSLFRDKPTIQAMEELVGMLHDSEDIIFTGRDAKGNFRKFGCCRNEQTVFVTKEYEAPEVKKYFENKKITGVVYSQAEHGIVSPLSIDKFIKEKKKDPSIIALDSEIGKNLSCVYDKNNLEKLKNECEEKLKEELKPNPSTKITNGDDVNKKIIDNLNKSNESNLNKSNGR